MYLVCILLMGIAALGGIECESELQFDAVV